MASKDQKNTLFIRNLPPTAAKSDLDSHFGGIGPLRHTIAVTEPGTEKCKGFGFVTFAFQEDAQNAMQSLHGSCIRGRKISLDVAKKRQRREESDIETAVPHEKRKRQPVKRKGAKKGSLAMRTVLITTAEKNGQLTEEDAKQAFGTDSVDAGFEFCVMSADSREARCTFSSWALAGKAAASAHGSKFHAVIEALRGGKKTRLIVRNLPFIIDENELRSRFQSIAPLRDLRLAAANALKVGASKNAKSVDSAMQEGLKENNSDRRNEQGSCTGAPTVRCGGYAFVEYFLVADAKFAITKLNGIKIGGRVIAVDLAIGKTAYEAQDQDDESGEESDAGENVGVEATDDVGDRRDADEPGGDTTLEASQKGKNVFTTNESAKPCKKGASSSEEELARTVFVRNLLFETSAPELWKAIEGEFGKVEQAVLVTHPVTKRPRGTAFVRFASAAAAKKAVEQAGEGDTTKQKSRNDNSLTARPKTSGFSLQGRQLMVSSAVDRSKAKDFEGSARNRKHGDPRNLRLAWIGMIRADSPEARGLTKEDFARRAKAVKEKKVKLERNPNVFVSEVRLCVRNLPKDLDEKVLKHMFLCAAQDKSLPRAQKQRLATADGKDVSVSEKRDKSISEQHQPRIAHITIVRDPQRKDRSKGYGFVQYEEHDDALRGLRLINNNPKAMEWFIKQRPKALKIDVHKERLMRKQWGDGRRLMVEFALEDTRKVHMIERLKEKGRKLAEENKRKRLEAPDGGTSEEMRKKRKKESGMNDDNTAGSKGQSSDPRLSKSEKRAALKRERATATNRKHENKKREKENRDAPVIETENSKKQSVRKPESAEGSKHRSRDQDFERMKEIEIPEPKPKKPKKKRKAAEIEDDNKFDRLLLSYKRRLTKTETLTPRQTENGAGNTLDARPRWFE